MEGKGVNFEENRAEVEEKEVEVDYVHDDFEEEVSNEDYAFYGFMPSRLVPLKEHLEKDKEDDSLRRWKAKLLGDIEEELIDRMEPEVIFHSVEIVSDGHEEMVIPLPVEESQNHVLFTLKEGTKYRLKLKFSVQHNIVSGLIYKNTVWKGRRKVDQTKGMLGTFAPSCNPYEEILQEETTPSGLFARGTYSAKLQFTDDDYGKHMDLNYKFEIKKH